jgi:hypothetical protein
MTDIDKTRTPCDCQLAELGSAVADLSFSTKVRYVLLRIGSSMRRRLARITNQTVPLGAPPREGSHSSAFDSGDLSGSNVTSPQGSGIEEGDFVRVRPLDEIRKTLNQNLRTNGLMFMTGMEKSCGSVFRVRKRVQTMFSEQSWKMIRIRDTFLLEGVCCTSRGMYEKEGCDRSCYFFWKGVWLEKIAPGDRPDPGVDCRRSVAGRWRVRLGFGFREGDQVEVRPLAEIKRLLDSQKRTDGLMFMHGMEKFCGQKFRVKKKMRAYYDERVWQMKGIRDAYLLDNAECDGLPDTCHRGCSYVWKKSWLRKTGDK